MNNILKEENFYQTADLSLAATISLFFPIDSIDRQDPRRATFFFLRDKKLDELTESYWRGKIRVEPQAFFNQLRIIKSRLYS